MKVISVSVLDSHNAMITTWHRLCGDNDEESIRVPALVTEMELVLDEDDEWFFVHQYRNVFKDGEKSPKAGDYVFLPVDSDWQTGIPKSYNSDIGIQRSWVKQYPDGQRSPGIEGGYTHFNCTLRGKIINGSMEWDASAKEWFAALHQRLNA